MVSQTEDSYIIALFFARREEALAETQSKYGNYIRTVVYNILRNEEDCEECVNDTLLAAWNNIPPTFPDSLKNYLATLARNIGLNCYKKKNATKRRGETEELLEEIVGFCPSDSPENALMAKELEKYINEFLETLDKTTRVCFVLRYYYAMTNEEIAHKTDKSTHAVASLLHKTRGRLKQFLVSRGMQY